MNTYSKFVPNVFLAKCDEKHEKGETITIETKYGQEHECIVYNLIYERGGFYFYSIVRADGFDAQERAKRKADRYRGYASNNEQISDAMFKKSQAITEHIPMGQPILVGHHSEKRHRADLDKSWNAMGKAVEASNKAEAYEGKAQYWDRKTQDVNLSMPESIEFFEHKLEVTKRIHTGMKEGTIRREHSMSLQYANKNVKEAEEKYKLALRLWS